VRIIAGRWRGRRLDVADAAGLRPTPDRVRETVFNWLQPVLDGARCLDLFAGSGVLGFEAASRGAAAVVMLERDARVRAALHEAQAVLGADTVDIIGADATAWLSGEGSAFDVVFLDPPYDQDLLQPCCELLETGGWLAPVARIYIEQGARQQAVSLPGNWKMERNKRAGDVSYALAVRGKA